MTERTRSKVDANVLGDVIEDFQTGKAQKPAFSYNLRIFNLKQITILLSDVGRSKSSGFCGLLLTALSFLLIFLTFPISIWCCLKVTFVHLNAHFFMNIKSLSWLIIHHWSYSWEYLSWIYKDILLFLIIICSATSVCSKDCQGIWACSYFPFRETSQWSKGTRWVKILSCINSIKDVCKLWNLF